MATSFEHLVFDLRNGDRGVRAGAARDLGRLRDARAVGPLIEALGDSGKPVRQAAMEALARFDVTRVSEALAGAGVKDALIHALGSRSADACDMAAEVLSRLGEKPLADAVINALAGDASAVVALRDPRAVGPLVGALDAYNSDIREAAAMALGLLGDPRAVEPLIGALDDSHYGVRLAAVRALGCMGEAAGPALRSLRRLLATEREEWARHPIQAALKSIEAALRQAPAELEAASYPGRGTELEAS